MKTGRTLQAFIRIFRIFAFLLASLVSEIGAQQDPKKTSDAMDALNKTATVTRDWLKGKPSSPGISTTAREINRASDGSQLIVKYNVYVKGAPKDQTYSLFQWPTFAPGPSQLLGGLTISTDGLVVCAGRTPEQCGDPQKKDDPVNLTFNPAKGEIQRLVLVSADHNTKVFFAIVPDPIVGKDKGCSVEIVRLTPKFEATLVLGSGFQPNESLQFTSRSYDESHDQRENADSAGEYTSALLPYVKGKQSGKTDIALKAANCAPSTSFEWGK